MSDKPTLDDINQTIERINIRGKQYATVDARVQAFWKLHPEGAIETEQIYNNGDMCQFKASVYDCGALLATGHASEQRSASAINKTSYVENCETSAVGRALGFLGIGSNGSIASADEVSAAIAQQAGAGRHEGRTAPQTAPDGLTAAKMRAWSAVKAWGAKTGKTGEQLLEAVRDRSDYAETEEFFNAIAIEFEEAL